MSILKLNTENRKSELYGAKLSVAKGLYNWTRVIKISPDQVESLGSTNALYYVTGSEELDCFGELKQPLHLHYSKRMIVDWFPHIAGTPLLDVVQTHVNKVGGSFDWTDYFDKRPRKLNPHLDVQTRYEDLLTAIVYCHLPDTVISELYPNNKPNLTKFIKSIAVDKMYAVFFQDLNANLTEQEKIVRVLLKCLKYNDDSDFKFEDNVIYLNVALNTEDDELIPCLRTLVREFEITVNRPEKTIFKNMLAGYILKPKELGAVMTAWKQEINFFNRTVMK